MAELAWFLTDDAYISFRYARNLIEGHGLVFNPGERVEGYSNLLRVLDLAALWAVFGLRPEHARSVALRALHGGTLGAVWWHAANTPGLERRTLTAWTATTLLATSATFAVWTSGGGLETRQFTFLVTLAFALAAVGWLLVQRRIDAGRRRPAVRSALALTGWLLLPPLSQEKRRERAALTKEREGKSGAERSMPVRATRRTTMTDINAKRFLASAILILTVALGLGVAERVQAAILTDMHEAYATMQFKHSGLFKKQWRYCLIGDAGNECPTVESWRLRAVAGKRGAERREQDVWFADLVETLDAYREETGRKRVSARALFEWADEQQQTKPGNYYHGSTAPSHEVQREGRRTSANEKPLREPRWEIESIRIQVPGKGVWHKTREEFLSEHPQFRGQMHPTYKNEAHCKFTTTYFVRQSYEGSVVDVDCREAKEEAQAAGKTTTRWALDRVRLCNDAGKCQTFDYEALGLPPQTYQTGRECHSLSRGLEGGSEAWCKPVETSAAFGWTTPTVKFSLMVPKDFFGGKPGACTRKDEGHEELMAGMSLAVSCVPGKRGKVRITITTDAKAQLAAQGLPAGRFESEAECRKALNLDRLVEGFMPILAHALGADKDAEEYVQDILKQGEVEAPCVPTK